MTAPTFTKTSPPASGVSLTPIDTTILKLVRGGTLPAVGTLVRNGVSLTMIDTRPLRWHQGAVGPTYPTLDPAAIGWDSGHMTGTDALLLTNGNLTARGNPGGARSVGSVRSTLALTTGKHYYEAHADLKGSLLIIGAGDTTTDGHLPGNGDSNSVGFWGAALNDRIGLAIDATARKVWWAQNNSWQNGDPAAGTGGGVALSGTNPIYPYIWCNSTGDQWTLNFGASAFTYTPPTGFSAP